MKARVLVAASSKARAKALSNALAFLDRAIDQSIGKDYPEDFSRYRLLVCEVGPRLKTPAPLLTRLRDDAHAVLILPDLDVRWVAYYMQDPRVNHFIAKGADVKELQSVVDKLETGQIFGMDRYLPPSANICYRRMASFKSRCETLEEIEAMVKKARLRGHLRRATVQVAEELLMNAMYQAPVDETGERVFANVSPRQRIRRRTPKPVSVRYAVHDKVVYLSVRDRHGSFDRADLAHYLLRCVTEESPIEKKQLGAGLGLYTVASTVDRLVVNILPGSISEFFCVLGERTSGDADVQLVSVTTQRPHR